MRNINPPPCSFGFNAFLKQSEVRLTPYGWVTVAESVRLRFMGTQST